MVLLDAAGRKDQPDLHPLLLQNRRDRGEFADIVECFGDKSVENPVAGFFFKKTVGNLTIVANGNDDIRVEVRIPVLIFR